MEKAFQRLLDNKFLVSLEHDIWSDKKREARRFDVKEYKNVLLVLLNTYQEKDIVVYTDYNFKN
jgi:hypothetical protein